MSRLSKAAWLLVITTVLVAALAVYLLRTNPIPEPQSCEGQPDAIPLDCQRLDGPTPSVPGQP